MSTYVRTTDGKYLVQVSDANAWGFVLADDDQSWPGGFGVAASWEAVPSNCVPADVRERLEYLLEDPRLSATATTTTEERDMTMTANTAPTSTPAQDPETLGYHDGVTHIEALAGLALTPADVARLRQKIQGYVDRGGKPPGEAWSDGLVNALGRSELLTNLVGCADTEEAWESQGVPWLAAYDVAANGAALAAAHEWLLSFEARS